MYELGSINDLLKNKFDCIIFQLYYIQLLHLKFLNNDQF